MNCETADNLILDRLYGELDDAARADLDAHLATCASCKATALRLERGRQAAAALPEVQAPDSLEARILAMLPAEGANAAEDVEPTEEAAKVVPIGSATASSARSRSSMSPSRRFFSAAGNWAMRPQTAMAAVFLLMVGTSTLALRMRHKNSEAAMSVSEQGTPLSSVSAGGADDEERPEYASGGTAHGVALAHRGAVAAAPAVAAPADPAPNTDRPGQAALSNAGPLGGVAGKTEASRDGDDKDSRAARGEGNLKNAEGEFGNAMSAYNARNFSEAIRRFDALAANGDKQAALWAARSVRAASGCSTALTRYDHLASTAFGTPAGYDATMEAGTCYRDLGYLESASSRFQRLLNVPTHADAARAALENVRQIASRRSEEMKGRGDQGQASGAGVGGAGGAARPAAPAAKPAKSDMADPFAAETKKAAPASPPPPPAPVATSATQKQ